MNNNYSCMNCSFVTEDPLDLRMVRDHNQRVMPGEIEPAGECPECGALVSVADSDIEEHTLRYIAEVMRGRGWTVVEPK